MDDIRAQEWAEVCWYFTETREQFRLSGKLAIVDADTSDSSAQEAGCLFDPQCIRMH